MREALWGLAGRGTVTERSVFGLVFYRRTISQHWTSLLHEVTTERGVRFGSVCIGWTHSAKHFLDGKEPSVVPGAYCR